MAGQPEIEVWEYALRSRGGLNAVSTRREFRGALVRADGGVGCLHPWPEFGDPPVEEQLWVLAIGGTSKVIERALRMAAVDGEARRRGVSLFEGLEIPRCHYSWDHHQPMEAQVARVLGEGWRAIKTKGWRETREVAEWVERFCHAVADSPVKVRIDFNSCLTREAFADWWRLLSPEARGRIDFVEDPFPYDPSAWDETRRELSVRLALDKQLRGASQGFDVAVLKPGRREWRELTDELPPEVQIVMTSAMDHAVGQSFAAWEAATAQRDLGARLDLCGLATEHLFEEDAFFARLHSRGGFLEVDRSGTGLGFDEIIAKLPWRRI